MTGEAAGVDRGQGDGSARVATCDTEDAMASKAELLYKHGLEADEVQPCVLLIA